MNMPAFPVDRHTHRCQQIESFGRNISRWVMVGVVLLGGYFVVARIKYDANVMLQQAKTAKVFSEGLAQSNSCMLILDNKGNIIKSNQAADDMFAAGANIEGRNVHDFCVNSDAIARGTEGMAQWFAASKPETGLLLFATARLATGVQDIVISGRTVPPQPGSPVAAVAIVSRFSKLDIRDVRIPPLQKEGSASR